MICPRCASNQSDDIKFCTSCGGNLQAVREALQAPDSGRKSGNNAWVESFVAGQEIELRKLEMERRMGITPEVKRYNEIKAGVIVSSVGVGLMIFLHIMMKAIAGVDSSDPDGAILRSVWVSGIIPFMVGLALIINGVVVSKRMNAVIEREQNKTKNLEEGPSPRGLRAPDTSEFVPANFSVTDQTTRHLENSERKIR
jgi:hypothetical protein